MCNNKKAIDRLNKRINEIKSKVTADFIDKEWLQAETEAILDEYMANGGVRPVMEIPKQLDLMERLLVKTHENIERLEIRSRSREEWEEIEQQFIPPEPIEVPEGYRVCACWNCNNVFKRKGKTMYCTPKCTQEQQDANDRIKETGTYLAPKRDNYKPNREENTGKKDRNKQIYTDKIEKYWRQAKRKETGNRAFSSKIYLDKLALKVKLRMGEKTSRYEEKGSKYNAFIQGRSPGIYTVNIKTGLKIYHENGKKHEYIEKDSSIGA